MVKHSNSNGQKIGLDEARNKTPKHGPDGRPRNQESLTTRRVKGLHAPHRGLVQQVWDFRVLIVFSHLLCHS